MNRLAIACAATAMIGSTSVDSASIYTMSPKMRDDVACMMSVLKKMPGIDQVKQGAFERQGWVYPYLQFRAAFRSYGNRRVVRYVAEQACTSAVAYYGDGTVRLHCAPHPGPYSFWALLPGLSQTTEPDDGGARAIEKRWRAKCGVDVVSFFV